MAVVPHRRPEASHGPDVPLLEEHMRQYPALEPCWCRCYTLKQDFARDLSPLTSLQGPLCSIYIACMSKDLANPIPSLSSFIMSVRRASHIGTQCSSLSWLTSQASGLKRSCVTLSIRMPWDTGDRAFLWENPCSAIVDAANILPAMPAPYQLSAC